MNTTIKFLSILLTLGIIAGCQQTSVHQHSDNHSHDGQHEHIAHHSESVNGTQAGKYQKPGAPIQMSHTYDGSIEIDQAETFELAFVSSISGELKVSVSSSEGIIVGGSQRISNQVSANEVVRVPITFQVLSDGQYNLNIQTSIGSEGRAFAIAIRTNGDKVSQALQKNTDGEPRVIIMEAVETIEY